MSSREWHPKTRNGCAQCKRRHVKCDLQGPTCGNCKRRSELCEYQARLSGLEVTPPPKSPDTVDAFRPEKTNTALVPTALDSIPFWHLMDCGSLISFGLPQTHDRSSIATREIDNRCFLQHAFLALSLLHASSDMSSATRSNYIVAQQHNIVASVAFRHASPNLTQDDWRAMLLFAMTTIAFQCRSGVLLSDTIEAHEILYMLREAAALASSVATPFLRMRSLESRSEAKHIPLYGEGLASLAALETFLASDFVDPESKEAYQQSLGALTMWMELTQGCPQTWLHLLAWPASVNQVYVDLLAQKDPLALVIFLHWCASMQIGSNTWFLEGWAAALAGRVFAHLDVDFQCLVLWPMRMFEADTGILEVVELPLV